MLSELFDTPARIRAIRSGSAGGLIEGFAEQLLQRGYSKISVRRHIRSAEHIVRWAVRQGLSTHDLCERAVESFGDHLGRCRCGHYCCANRAEVVAGARLFVGHLQGVEGSLSRRRQPASAEPELLMSFCSWMRERRGTSDRGLYNYSIPIRELIICIGADPSLGCSSPTAVCLEAESRWPMGSDALQDGATYVPAVSDRGGSLPCGPAGRNSRRTVLASDLASTISAARGC